MISKCCSAEIEKRHGKFSPDNSGLYIHTSYDACSKCSEEYPEAFECQCECCGDGVDHVIGTTLGEWCKSCVSTYSDELMERAK